MIPFGNLSQDFGQFCTQAVVAELLDEFGIDGSGGRRIVPCGQDLAQCAFRGFNVVRSGDPPCARPLYQLFRTAFGSYRKNGPTDSQIPIDLSQAG